MIALLFVLLMFAGFFKGMMDATADLGLKNNTWQKKYDFTRGYRKHWWYLGLYKPRYSEKFPFSSTVLVFLTDNWHLYQFLMLRCLYLSIAIFVADSFLMILACTFFLFPTVLGYSFEGVYSIYKKHLLDK